ncbi:WapI family immunity protein [Pantoea cypripedii]|jgi:hypothetical protein|uniref:Uncharacterized protein n=1 Tax=Pantoea cypripedii TaxID=55209 RepID=A0A6B9GC74_PANCY|nr:hypothetical protein [Pantoea cypripedii]QGY32980.1 hypothetical protein CUN67_29055 [Pantoea cypripedii]
MIEIQSGTRIFNLSPYQRIPEPEAPSYDRIMVWVEFSVPVLTTAFEAEFAAGQLTQFRSDLLSLHQSLKTQTKHTDVVFSDLFNQISIKLHQSSVGNAVGVDLVLRPEGHADSVTLSDFFGLDESYFPAIISGLNEMINWPV